MSHRQEEGTTARAVFLFLLFLSRHPSSRARSPFSPSLPIFLEKLRVRVTRLQRVTRRWADTGKGIPGHWSRRRLSDVLSFVGVCVTGALYSTAIEPPRGSLSLSSVSSFAALLSRIALRGRLSYPPLFFVPAFRPSTARPVPVSSSLVSRDFKASPVSLAIRSSVYSRHCETKAAPYLFRISSSINPRSPSSYLHYYSSSTHSVPV